MKIFNKIGDLLFKILKLIGILIIILILCFIIKWRIDKLYIDSVAKAEVKFSLNDEYFKTVDDINKIFKPEEAKSTPTALLEEKDNENIISITIPEGAKIEEVGQILKENNFMTDIKSFKELLYRMGVENKIIPGTYEIPKDTKIRDTILKITGTRSNTYELEISNGAAADAVGAKLQKMGIIESGTTFAQKCKEHEVYYKMKPGKYTIQTPLRVQFIIQELTGETIK